MPNFNQAIGRVDDSFQQLDLSGKLIIKVQLGEDIRRIPIHNEEITYDELVLMMQRVYRGKLDSNDEIIIKYRDDDGDLVTIFDSADLSFAIQCSRILKITLFVNGLPLPLETNEMKHIRKELQRIRDTVNGLLDRLDPTSDTSEDKVRETSGAVEEKGNDNAPVRQVPSQPVINSANVNVGRSKEFDPLVAQKSIHAEDGGQQKVMTAFGISEAGSAHQRGGSPDSISSLGSSAGLQNKFQQHQPQQQYQMDSTGHSAALHSDTASHSIQQPQAISGFVQQAGGYSGGQAPVQPSAYSQLAAPQQQQQYPAGYTGPQQQQVRPQQYPGQQQQGQVPQQAVQQQAGVNQQQGYQQQNYSPQHQQQQPRQMQQPGQPQQQFAYTQGYPTQTSAPQQQPAPGANPYSLKGPSYGQYPRPQGQYPQYTQQ